MFALPERHLSRHPVPTDAGTRSSSTVGDAAVAHHQGGLQFHLVQALVLGHDYFPRRLDAHAETAPDKQTQSCICTVA